MKKKERKHGRKEKIENSRNQRRRKIRNEGRKVRTEGIETRRKKGN